MAEVPEASRGSGGGGLQVQGVEPQARSSLPGRVSLTGFWGQFKLLSHPPQASRAQGCPDPLASGV